MTSTNTSTSTDAFATERAHLRRLIEDACDHGMYSGDVERALEDETVEVPRYLLMMANDHGERWASLNATLTDVGHDIMGQLLDEGDWGFVCVYDLTTGEDADVIVEYACTVSERD